jgi:hypothetical protein
MKDGIYKSKDAVYFIKGGRILANIAGGYYKVTENFMLGTWEQDLSDNMCNSFDRVYESSPNW